LQQAVSTQLGGGRCRIREQYEKTAYQVNFMCNDAELHGLTRSVSARIVPLSGCVAPSNIVELSGVYPEARPRYHRLHRPSYASGELIGALSDASVLIGVVELVDGEQESRRSMGRNGPLGAGSQLASLSAPGDSLCR
jgi:hypothetical protein